MRDGLSSNKTLWRIEDWRIILRRWDGLDGVLVVVVMPHVVMPHLCPKRKAIHCLGRYSDRGGARPRRPTCRL
jgi:hypothetical protein